jgi:hypothetical protein
MSEKHETNTEHLYRLAGAEGGNEACLTKMMKIPRIHPVQEFQSLRHQPSVLSSKCPTRSHSC